MKLPLFVFLGVVEDGTDANINTLQNRLEVAFFEFIEQVSFKQEDELLIFTVNHPQFRFYISFANNDSKTLANWKEFARNAELPWDIKPVDKSRLSNTLIYLHENGWAEYDAVLNFGHTILKEIERFSQVKTFTIPSVGKSSMWSKLFRR